MLCVHAVSSISHRAFSSQTDRHRVATHLLAKIMRTTRSTVSTTRSGKKRAGSPLLSAGMVSGNIGASKKCKTDIVDDTEKIEKGEGKVGGSTEKKGKANENVKRRKTRSVSPTSRKPNLTCLQSLQEEIFGCTSCRGCQCKASISPYEVSILFRSNYVFLL
jgi:hypothetical protein